MPGEEQAWELMSVRGRFRFQEFGHLVRRNWLTEIVALVNLATVLLQQMKLIEIFDTLGDYFETKVLGKCQNRRHHGLIARVVTDILDKRAIDLDVVYRQVL